MTSFLTFKKSCSSQSQTFLIKYLQKSFYKRDITESQELSELFSNQRRKVGESSLCLNRRRKFSGLFCLRSCGIFFPLITQLSWLSIDVSNDVDFWIPCVFELKLLKLLFQPFSSIALLLFIKVSIILHIKTKFSSRILEIS